jgi:hypothetical protein
VTSYLVLGQCELALEGDVCVTVLQYAFKYSTGQCLDDPTIQQSKGIQQ